VRSEGREDGARLLPGGLRGETGSYLHRVEGGFWTYDGCGVNAAGIPNWWVSWQTVRAMERKGLLARSWFYVEEWKDHRGFPERAGR
jgi:hypothetical protein